MQYLKKDVKARVAILNFQVFSRRYVEDIDIWKQVFSEIQTQFNMCRTYKYFTGIWEFFKEQYFQEAFFA